MTMRKEFVTDETGKVKAIISHHKVEGENYGDYCEVPINATQEQVEQVYWNVWRQAKAFCEKAGADPNRVQMVISMPRCAVKREEDCGFPSRLLPGNAPIMTIGWKVHLTDEENARLSKEDIASIAGGAFVKEE